jgi:hypothetical protein
MRRDQKGTEEMAEEEDASKTFLISPYICMPQFFAAFLSNL